MGWRPSALTQTSVPSKQGMKRRTRGVWAATPRMRAWASRKAARVRRVGAGVEVGVEAIGPILDQDGRICAREKRLIFLKGLPDSYGFDSTMFRRKVDALSASRCDA